MMPYVWRNDFQSGNQLIDDEYKGIYKLFNVFFAENEEHATCESVHKLTKELMPHAATLFSIENEMMKKESYPLVSLHAAHHLKIRGNLKNLIEASAGGFLEMPHKAVIDFAKLWLKEHQANDDTTFYSFCQNKETDLGGHLKNLICNVTNMKDKFITSGMILSTESNSLRIELPDDTNLKLSGGEMVKITAKSKFGRVQTIIALVGNFDSKELLLFNAKVLDASNNRAMFRVQTKIKANVLTEGSQIPATITNISSGGILLDTPGPHKTGSILNMEFMIQNYRIIEPAEVVRVIESDDGKTLYSLKFVAISPKDQDKIDSYVLNKQIMGVR